MNITPTAPTLVKHLYENQQSRLVVFWSVYHKEFQAELHRQLPNGVDTVTIGGGKTPDEAINIVDATLLAESLKSRLEGLI